MDYFFPGYAVWAKLIEAAADMGYDTNNLVCARQCCKFWPLKGQLASVRTVGCMLHAALSLTFVCSQCCIAISLLPQGLLWYIVDIWGSNRYSLVSQIGETYDWRLSVPNMEARDNYFTRLKWRLELSLKTEGEKVRPLAL